MTINVAPERSTLSLPGVRLRADQPTLRAGPNGVTSGPQSQPTPAAVNVSRTALPDAAGLRSAASGLDRASSVVDTARAASDTVVDLLGRLREAAAQGGGGGIGAILKQIDRTVRDAGFDGANLLDGSSPGSLSLTTQADGSGEISIAGHDLRPGGPIVPRELPGEPDGAVAAADAALVGAETARDGLREDSKRLEAHRAFVGLLSDAVAGGTETLDIEGARLAALSVKQALGGTTLALSNPETRTVLSLFR